MARNDPLLLTGATGFVGMSLLARYLERTDRRIYALVRARDDADASARLQATIARVVPDPRSYVDRVVAVRGDVARPGLGLAAHERDELAASVREIVHAAASVSFTLSLPEARAINVEGTRNILEFGDEVERRGGLRRLAYVSTAYVAGDRRGVFTEDDLDVGQGFRNAYERSKFEAEQVLRAHMDRLPIQVFRPSIVVGEEDTGWTPAFNVIYWPLRAFASGAYRAIPARVSAPVDVVSISYVADAVFELSGRDEGAGETYHLAAGDRASNVGELLELSAAYFDRPPPATVPPNLYRRLVHPLLLWRSRGRRRAALEASEAFFPYFAMRVAYDTTRARDRLEPAGIAVTPLRAYFDRLMAYAQAARWGRATPHRFQRPPLPA